MDRLKECKITKYTAVVEALTPDKQRDRKLAEFASNPVAAAELEFLSPSVLFDDNGQVGLVLMYTPGSPLRALLDHTDAADMLNFIRSVLAGPVGPAKTEEEPARYKLFFQFKGLPV